MRTVKPKSNRKKIIAVIVLIAVIAGGVAGYLLLSKNSASGSGPSDFSVIVQVGDPTQDYHNWRNVTSVNNILLNGSSLQLVVWVRAYGSYRDLFKLKLANPVNGVTSKLVLDTLSPIPGTSGPPRQGSWTGLSLTAAANIPTRELPYNFTVTATSVSGSISHNATFPIKLRASTISLSPSLVQTQAGTNTIFTVRVGVSDVYAITGFQLTLGFNSSVIGVLNNTNGQPTFAPIFYPPNGFIVPSIISNSSNVPGYGQVQLVAVILTQACDQSSCINSPAPRVYNIANVTFVSNSGNAGRTPLLLTNVILTELGIVSISPPSTIHLMNGSVANLRTTTTAVSCSPSSVTPGGQPSTCTATVTDTSPGTAISPTGLVSFTSSLTGTFSATSCTLSASATSASASCAVTFSPLSVGTITITGSYGGDSVHFSSSGRYMITSA